MIQITLYKLTKTSTIVVDSTEIDLCSLKSLFVACRRLLNKYIGKFDWIEIDDLSKIKSEKLYNLLNECYGGK